MKQFLNGLNVWKLALVRLSIHCFIAGGTAYTTSMSGVKWTDLDRDQQFMVLLGVSIIIASNIHAFLDRTIERISQGKPPIETGTTQFINKPQ